MYTIAEKKKISLLPTENFVLGTYIYTSHIYRILNIYAIYEDMIKIVTYVGLHSLLQILSLSLVLSQITTYGMFIRIRRM